jgi:hypothetical protein
MLYTVVLNAPCCNHRLLHWEGSSTVECLISRLYTFICRDSNHRTGSRMTTKNLTRLQKLFNIRCAWEATLRFVPLKSRSSDRPCNLAEKSVCHRRSQCIVSFVPLLEKMIISCFFSPKDASSKR